MLFSLSSCANYNAYTINEQELSTYIQEHINLNKSMLIPGIVEGHILLSNIEVGIGRVADDRLHIKAHANGKIRFLNQDQQSVETVFSFSAIPYYNKEKSAIYLKQLQLESIQTTPFSLGEMGQELAQLSLPVLNLYLENEAVYQLDRDKLSSMFLNHSQPILIISNHQIILSINNHL